ncbi:glycoside hydrolase family 32 protein [Phytoactinopolyspora endophytica]|uniref:glycoside hydrolase family 32 protein n=1 Tax=Phytoactinopolyspora endophytica TaxID=1642495 RepID=UPI0013EE11B6|nr:glycoside hydrolase family 32 protein [Phytoactinopolyspora endophytica]
MTQTDPTTPTTPAADTAAPGFWRPRYHVTGARNWINDPNGPVQWDGRYHLFFQANPDAPFWGPPRWGHVSSPDLVRWTRHDDAIAPSPQRMPGSRDSDGMPDSDGCWSGCLREVSGRPAIYYTGVVGDDDDRIESVCRAWGSADLTEWTKDDANPLIPAPPADLGSGYHRDPFVWHDGERWQMLLGSGTVDGQRHGTVLLYESRDATSWEYRGIFYSAPRIRDGLDLGEHWECPQLVFSGDRVLLIVSCQVPDAVKPLMHSVYFAGTVADGRFVGEQVGLLDYGDAFYAPAVTTDESGRTLMWGWAQERVPARTQAEMRHVGALSLPRTVSLDGDRARAEPASELRRLRLGPVVTKAELATGVVIDRPALELAGNLNEGVGGWSIVSGESELNISVDPPGTIVNVEVSDSTAGTREFTVPRPRTGEFSVFVDGSLVELFTGDGAALTTRVYWSNPELTVTSGAEAYVHVWNLDTAVLPDA